MANISNRSPWMLQIPGARPKKFRSQKEAQSHLLSLGYDTQKLPRNALTRPDTAFEVQITMKDKQGNEAYRSGTFDNQKQAQVWADAQERELREILAKQGAFTVGFETITVESVLDQLLETHYKGKASYNEISYRMPRLKEWLGPKKRFRDLNRVDMTDLLATLEDHGYSPSSIRNYFTILTTLYKKAKNRWHFPVENIASGLELPKPSNVVERYWVGDEKERLMKSLSLRSPWLVPIVELSLELAFRRGELVQAPVRAIKNNGVATRTTMTVTGKVKKNTPATGAMTGGLRWEYIDWQTGRLALPKEKNDHTKKRTEARGREVPITPKMKEILMPLYEASPTKKGLVFRGTINSVSTSFRIACEKAEPPIVGLTFHSLRKIATKDLSHRVANPKELGMLSGHKTMQVLFDRYFDVTIEQLAALLNKSSGSIRDRGIAALTAALGYQNAKKFVSEIMTIANVEDAFKVAELEVKASAV